jgi:arylsulfatase A-like enzyme
MESEKMNSKGSGPAAAGTDAALLSSSQSKPNIVLILTDQQSADAMSCAGHPHLRTPALDSLAAQGLRFDKAYCAFPLCVPSRVSLFSGRPPHEAGVFANCAETAEPFPFPIVGALLREAGYATHYIGKWHLTFSEQARAAHGFDEVVYGGGYGDLDSKKAEAAVAFLKKKHDRPFFLVVSFNNPHDCCEWARGQALRMEPLPPEPPPEAFPPLPANAAVPADEPDCLRAFQREKAYPLFPSANWTDDQFRRYRWGYNRLVEMADRHIGTVLEALRGRGPGGETAVLFTSDHGDGQGCHRWNQKWSLYDESVRVPFIVAWPGRTEAGRVRLDPVSSGLDLAPTLCDIAGVPAPGGCRGASVLREAGGRDYVVSETSLGGDGGKVGEDRWPKGRMVRTFRYKYCVFDTGAHREQLFDLEQDPGETVSVAGDPAFRDVLESHRGYLREWCGLTNDSFQA